MKSILMVVFIAGALACSACAQKKSDEKAASPNPLPQLSADCGATKCV